MELKKKKGRIKLIVARKEEGGLWEKMGEEEWDKFFQLWNE